MHCLVLDKLTTKECLVSAIYVPARESQKDDFLATSETTS